MLSNWAVLREGRGSADRGAAVRRVGGEGHATDMITSGQLDWERDQPRHQEER